VLVALHVASMPQSADRMAKKQKRPRNQSVRRRWSAILRTVHEAVAEL